MISSTEKDQDIERGERLRAERERLGLSLVDFAAKSGISKGSQRLYEKGRPPTADYLVAIGEFGVKILFVLTGQRDQDVKPRIGSLVRKLDGTVVSRYDGPVQGDAAQVADTHFNEMIRLPRYQLSASAGPGVQDGAEQPFGVIALDRQFLRDRGATPEHCTVIRARGDSMMPTIPDGSLLIVDHSQQQVANGFITVIGIGDDLLVKRIRRRLDGMIDLISDNPAYQVESIAPDRLEHLRIIGRVIYFCREP